LKLKSADMIYAKNEPHAEHAILSKVNDFNMYNLYFIKKNLLRTPRKEIVITRTGQSSL